MGETKTLEIYTAVDPDRLHGRAETFAFSTLRKWFSQAPRLLGDSPTSAVVFNSGDNGWHVSQRVERPLIPRLITKFTLDNSDTGVDAVVVYARQEVVRTEDGVDWQDYDAVTGSTLAWRPRPNGDSIDLIARGTTMSYRPYSDNYIHEPTLVRVRGPEITPEAAEAAIEEVNTILVDGYKLLCSQP